MSGTDKVNASGLLCYSEDGDLIETHIFPSAQEAMFSIPRVFLNNPLVETIVAGNNTISRDHLTH